MARTPGSVATETSVTVPVFADYVMSARGKRFVFLQHVQPKLYEISRRVNGNRRMYDNFIRGLRMGMYNIARIYGLDAINIDEPQLAIVSVRLKFELVEKGADAELALKKIEKPAL